jgi:hypothetical protein
MAPDTPSAPPRDPPAERLDSWKEIARYLKRDESTVQRWEKRENMPVHRHVHAKRGSVYAYRAEIDGWWQGRRRQLEPAKGQVAGHLRRWWIAPIAALTFVWIGIAAFMWTPRTRTPGPDADLTLGDKLLFLGERVRDPEQSSLDWYVMGLHGGETVRTGALEVLRRAGLTGVPIPGAWTPDGEVVFGTEGQAPSSVWQLAISPDTGRVAGEPVRLTFGTAIERAPAVGPSGEVVFTSVTENVDIWRLPLDTTGVGNGPLERVTDNAAHDRFINASTDGKTLAFMSSRTGHDEVRIRDLHTGDDRQMTRSGAQWARLSPDGSTLAVARGGPQKPGIDLVPIGSGPTSQLCDDCHPGDWSPDGTRLVVLRGTPSRLFVRDIGSGRETELAAHPSWSLLQPRFSPDSRWIVFHTANSPSLRQIYAVPATSDGPVPVDNWIPVVEDFGLQPAWAPDGSAVYQFSLRDGAFCAWLQPIDPATSRPAGSPRAVHHLHQPGLRAVTGAAVTNHVAAGYLYVTLTTSAANIWMLHRPPGSPAR